MADIQAGIPSALDQAADMTACPAQKTAAKAAKAGKRPGKWTYKRSKNWEYRREYMGHDLSGSGFKTEAAARKELNARVAALDRGAKPAGLGAGKTTVAQALQDYALARLPYLKGAPQEARRINCYLRAAGLSLLEVEPVKKANQQVVADGQKTKKTGKTHRFTVKLVPHTLERVIPNGLHDHRKALMTQSADTDRRKAVLASKAMNAVTRNEIQQLVSAMETEKHAPATIALERSVLRVLFNYAYTKWNWAELMDNPATKLTMPEIPKGRTRVMSLDEQALLEEAFAQCRNKYAAPALRLIWETAMRASEPLEHATWGDVDWERCVLKLSDSKTGAREVPLSPEALNALRALGPGAPQEPLIEVTYEALKGAWKDACMRAGIRDLRIHDLRHTAATRLALKSGNVFLVKELTGHGSFASLERYINVTPDDVVKVLHAAPADMPPPASRKEPTPPSMPEPAGGLAKQARQATKVLAVSGNVVTGAFRKAA